MPFFDFLVEDYDREIFLYKIVNQYINNTFSFENTVELNEKMCLR